MKRPEDRFTGFIDLQKLGGQLHALCPRSRNVGDACEGTSRVCPDGLRHDCAACGIQDELLLPKEHENTERD